MQSGGLVVRNTFIDSVADDDDEEDDPLGRSQSDPIGGRPRKVSPLVMADIRVPPPIEESDQEIEGADPAAGAPLSDNKVSTADDDDCDYFDAREEDGESSDDSPPLVRNAPVCSDATPHLNAVGASSSGGRVSSWQVDLANLLPEDENSTCRELAGGAQLYEGGMPGMPGAAWPYMMPGMFDQYSMFPMGGYPSADTAAPCGIQGHAESAPSDWRPPLPALGTGPPLGYTHSFHQEIRNMGTATPDFRQFTKVSYEGRLSVVSESQVHSAGVQRYLVQFTAGELSPADGVGFVFSPRLPCAKNIQRIVSIFVNQRGRICMRIFADLIKASAFIKPLKCGDWVEMAIDLESRVITFHVWPATATGWPAQVGQPSSSAEFAYGAKLAKLNQSGTKSVNVTTGYLACVVKNPGVTITLGS